MLVNLKVVQPRLKLLATSFCDLVYSNRFKPLKSLQNPAKMIIPPRRSVAGVPQRRKTILVIIALLFSLVSLLCPAAVIPSNVSSSLLCREPGADDLVGWMVAQWETARAVDKSCHDYVLADLPSAGHSLWACIQKNGRDAAYTEFIGLANAGFSKLEQAFTPLFNAEVHRRKPKGSNRGRPRRLKSQDVLALTLQYLRDGVDQKHFQGDVGTPSSNISRDIKLGLDVRPHALLTFKTGRVDGQNHVEMEDHVKDILHRNPDLEGRRKKAISWEMNGCLSNREMLNVTEHHPAAQTMQAATGVPRSLEMPTPLGSQ